MRLVLCFFASSSSSSSASSSSSSSFQGVGMGPVHTVLRNVTFLDFSQHVPSSHVICSSMTESK